MVDLGAFAGNTSSAADINDHGAVVGNSNVGPPSYASHPFVWTAQSGMVDLGVPEGFFDASAFSINNAGQVVGYSFDPIECRAVGLLWSGGTLYQLDNIVLPGSGWTIIQPTDINDLGHILALATRTGTSYQPVLLVAVRTCNADFNCDGDIGTDTDIQAFFACLAGNCPDALTCGAGADFNGDGDVGTDADIEAFFRVLAGGPC
jgi:probable HAF family extracellular repeat protein